jgi:hypothetical protein
MSRTHQLRLPQPTLLRDLGWTATKAQLYTVPPYVCACVVAIAVAFVSDKTNRRGIYLAGFTFLGIAGFAILRWSHDPNVRYAGVFLITLGAFPGGPGFLAWSMNNASGPAIRAVSGAYVVTLGTAGGVLATWYVLCRLSPARGDQSLSLTILQDLPRERAKTGVSYRSYDQPCWPNLCAPPVHWRHTLL